MPQYDECRKGCPVRIQSVRIKHFRCFTDEEVHLESLTAFVGPNGAGKSTVVRGIRVFYEHAGATLDDFYNRDESVPIEITIRFGDLGQEEQLLFAPYIDKGTLAVTKVITLAGFKYHGARLQCPEFEGARSLDGKQKRLNAYKALQARVPDLPNAKSADEADRTLADWEATHPEMCRLMKDDGQFFGFKQVGMARLERFTRYVFVPAVRDAEKDAGDARGSAIFELMELVVRSVLAQNKAFADFRTRVQGEYGTLISPKNVPQIGQLAEELTGILQHYVPTAGVILDWLAPEELKLPLPNAGVRLEEDGFVAPVDRVGHGLQRAFILSLLQSLVAAQHLHVTAQGQDEHLKPPEHMPDLILGIEEPELYQHPNRQRHLARILWDLSEGKIPGVARRTQVIYCTHSPLFVDLTRFDCIRRFSKTGNPDDATKPLISRCSRNTLAGVAQSLQQAHEVRPARPFTAQSLRARLITLMTPWSNEGFFGDCVVLVEGEDDRAALVGAAHLRGTDLESKGIAVIPAGGKNNLDRLYLVFRGFNIPVYVVFDGDVRDTSDQESHKKANRLLQMLLECRDIKDFPTTQVSDRYAIFQDKLETEIRGAVGEQVYTDSIMEFACDYGYTDRAACLKSPVFVQTLLTKADAQTNPVAILDNIVNSILALADAARPERPKVSQPSA